MTNGQWELEELKAAGLPLRSVYRPLVGKPTISNGRYFYVSLVGRPPGVVAGDLLGEVGAEASTGE